jgi:hypothetical protein
LMADNVAAVLHGVDDLRVESFPLPGLLSACRSRVVNSVEQLLAHFLICRRPPSWRRLVTTAPVQCFLLPPRLLAGGPPDGHVRVEMKAVGICGSDVHYLKRASICWLVCRAACHWCSADPVSCCCLPPFHPQGRIAHFVVEQPMVIGHESAGTVAAVGRGVTSLRVGDRVALEPGVPCCSHRHSRRV